MKAFNAKIRRLVKSTARRRKPPREWTVDDLTQISFWNVCRLVDDLEDIPCPELTIPDETIYKAIDRAFSSVCVKHYRHLKSNLPQVTFTDKVDDSYLTSDDAKEVEDRFDFEESLRRLSDEEREIIAMRQKGWTNEQMAEHLGSSTATVKRRLRKIRERLKHLLKVDVD